MDILIACHAGIGVGLGHLTRSLVVANALRQRLAANVHLLIQGGRAQHADLAKFSHHFIGIAEQLSDAINQEALRLAAKVVIFDLQRSRIPPDIDLLFEDLRKRNCKIIGVDSLDCHQYGLDLLFIPSFRFSPSEGVVGTAPVLFGWDCFLLYAKSQVPEWKAGHRVLVLSGGSDTTGVGRTLPTLLNEALPAGTHLEWITGPYAQQPVFPEFARFTLVNYQAPSCLDNFMVSTNYAMTVYGVSFFELLHYGVPTVVFSPYGNNDDAELSAIAEAGVALVARDEVEAVNMLKELMADSSLAASMSQQARQKLSILGDNKFVQAVKALLV